MSLMSSFKLPCGSKNNYPEKLDYLTRKGNYVVFHSLSEKDRKAYLVFPLKKGVELLTSGSAMEIMQRYEDIDLTEQQIADANGIFFYKIAETKDEYNLAVNKVLKRE